MGIRVFQPWGEIVDTPGRLTKVFSGPSGYANIFTFLPAIKPVNYIDQAARGYEEDNGKRCTLCHQAWAGALRCKDEHVFHLKCIFKYWDEPGRIFHSCPICKQAPYLNFQDLEIDSEDVSSRTMLIPLFLNFVIFNIPSGYTTCSEIFKLGIKAHRLCGYSSIKQC